MWHVTIELDVVNADYLYPTGAAGNFLAPISGLSENAFRTVLEIDAVRSRDAYFSTSPAHFKESKEHSTQSKLLYPMFEHLEALISMSARRCTTTVSSASYDHQFARYDMNSTGTPFQAHVSAAKAAVDALSAVLAVEEGPHGVRSNVISPGPTSGTEGIDRLAAGYKRELLIPAGRYGDVKDIANAAVFLFSDASSYITGQVLPVDGGHEHLRSTQLPYPQAVLDPTSVKHLIKPKL
jgi:peroxisomal 2,4-dienoyl-CoA reductase